MKHQGLAPPLEWSSAVAVGSNGGETGVRSLSPYFAPISQNACLGRVGSFTELLQLETTFGWLLYNLRNSQTEPNDVLSFQRLQDQRMHLELLEFDVASMIRHTLHSFQTEFTAKSLTVHQLCGRHP